MLINGKYFDLSDKKELDENIDYNVEIVLGRFTLKKSMYIQIAKTIEARQILLYGTGNVPLEMIEPPFLKKKNFYVMDEPSIGLHPRDSVKVIDIMKRLRDIGNTVIVVEHDLETMNNADFLVEIGPGIHGGNIIVTGVSGSGKSTLIHDTLL